MSKIEIKSWVDGSVLWSGEAETMRGAVEKAVKDGASLDGASLDRARLVGASLDGARLDGARLDRARLDGASLIGASLVGARLDRARLDRARLDGASLDRARLDRARLDGASLVGASLDRARLDPIRDDFYLILDAAPAEVPALIAALRDGRVEGSTYEGQCACLVGTLANVRGVSHRELTGIRPDSSRPAEVWFLSIHEGDTPENNQPARIAVEWAEEWLTKHGREVPVHRKLYWRGDLAKLRSDLEAVGVDMAALAVRP